MSVNQKDTFSDAELQAEWLLQKASVKVDLFELLYYTFKEEKLQRKRCYIRMQHLYYYIIGR